MPTGYTASIEDGEITNAKDFILLCTRAFGVALDVRDEPLNVPTPIEFEPDLEYHTKCLEKELKEKERLLNISDEDFHKEIVELRENAIKRATERFKLSQELDAKYEAILKDIESWNPPDEYNELKAFAINQIEISRPDLEWQKKHIEKSMVEDPDDVVKKELLDSCKCSIEYHQKEIKDEIDRAEAKTKFMKDLIESLKQLD